MKRTYSLYEAKAKLSQIVREVRQHRHSVTISYHGEPVVEIRPVDTEAEADPLRRRMRMLEEQGALSPARPDAPPLRPIAKRPGALERFLAEREADEHGLPG
jgi:prevent-host-death family protein